MSRTEQQPIVFVAPSRRMLVFLHDVPYDAKEMFYSPDGNTFYELNPKRLSSHTGPGVIEFDSTVEDVHHGTTAELCRKNYVVTYNGEEYLLVENIPFDVSKAIPLPTVRQVEYLCQFPGGTFVYVSTDKYRHSLESFRLFVGDGQMMREIPITGAVLRPHNGATTYIETQEGTFFSPSLFEVERDRTLTPRLGGRNLVKLDPNDYNIADNGNTVTITKR